MKISKSADFSTPDGHGAAVYAVKPTNCKVRILDYFGSNVGVGSSIRSFIK